MKIDMQDIAAYRRVRPDRLALLFGSEMPGLNDSTLAAADERVRIPQRPDFDSLNVATASGIALYELAISR